MVVPAERVITHDQAPRPSVLHPRGTPGRDASIRVMWCDSRLFSQPVSPTQLPGPQPQVRRLGQHDQNLVVGHRQTRVPGQLPVQHGVQRSTEAAQRAPGRGLVLVQPAGDEPRPSPDGSGSGPAAGPASGLAVDKVTRSSVPAGPADHREQQGSGHRSVFRFGVVRRRRRLGRRNRRVRNAGPRTPARHRRSGSSVATVPGTW